MVLIGLDGSRRARHERMDEDGNAGLGWQLRIVRECWAHGRPRGYRRETATRLDRAAGTGACAALEMEAAREQARVLV